MIFSDSNVKCNYLKDRIQRNSAGYFKQVAKESSPSNLTDNSINLNLLIYSTL